MCGYVVVHFLLLNKSREPNGADNMATDYKLTYLNGRGRGEIIRLVLATAGVPFEDVRVDRSDMPALKPSESTPVAVEYISLMLCNVEYVLVGKVARCKCVMYSIHGLRLDK